jgi:4-amino-4-deoxy-L-arabinose transferase-like glycosyltransferase
MPSVLAMSTPQPLSSPLRVGDQISDLKMPAGRATLFKFFAALFAVTFLLHIFYSSNLCQDDGFWFTAGEEILRGKALYREIYFDKPPFLPLVYAFLFWIFGAHIVVIRLFTIFYLVGVSAVLYRFGSRLYDRRVGMVAAAMFTLFSTTSVNNHEQGFSTDMLLILPYTAGAYFTVRACFERRTGLALIAGAMAGIAAQANPKGTFGLPFFAALLAASLCWQRAEKRGLDSPFFSRAVRLALAALAGFAAGTLPFIAYILWHGSFAAYWLSVWEWGWRYSAYYPAWKVAGRGLWLTATFFARDNTLLFGLIFFLALVCRSLASARRLRRPAREQQVADNGSASGLNGDLESSRLFKSDITLLIWFLVSYAALAVGGRFFANYFFQILPSLCLIGGRGLLGIGSALKASRPRVRRLVFAAMAAGLMITLIRFHTRTAELAIDWARGTRSALNANWFHEKLNREEQLAAATVRNSPEPADPANLLRPEALRADSPRTRGAAGGSDYLFVWGYRAEIYYWSGLLPASRYLSTQLLTGVPADVHHEPNSHSILDESVTVCARSQLLSDLNLTQPRYIVDEIGFFTNEHSIQSYPELREFMTNYKNIGIHGTFIIYRKNQAQLKE